MSLARRIILLYPSFLVLLLAALLVLLYLLGWRIAVLGPVPTLTPTAPLIITT